MRDEKVKTKGGIVSRCISVVLFLLSLVGAAFSQNSHNVTIIVPSMVHSLVVPAALQITIDGSGTVAGGSSFQKIDETTTLYWATNYLAGKITVQTNLAAPRYTLRILALNPTPPGIASSELVPSTTAQNLITGIGRSMGSCTIRFTGVALAIQAGGFSDNHTITYTVTIL
jgi:hypothetical protein